VTTRPRHPDSVPVARVKPSETESAAVIFDPATGREIGRRPWDDPRRVDDAFARARRALPSWRRTSPRERARRVRPLSRWLEERSAELASLVAACTGKPRLDAVATEILPAAIATRHYCRMAPRWLAPESPAHSNPAYLLKRVRVHRVPHGIVGIITPWNYPLGIAVHEIVAALLGGNAVLFKPAAETTPVGEALAEGIRSLDLPDGLFQHLVMPGPAAGERFLGEDPVDKLSFTGSVAVGRHLARKAGERFIPVTLELGGKDAMLVCDDAPMPRTANGAVWAGFQNGGQACAGVERIYVEDGAHDRLVEAVAHRISRLRVGPPEDHRSDVGPLIGPRQHEHVRRQVDEAVAAGARVEAQASLGVDADARGFYFPPILLTGVHEEMGILREETFGPVLAVCRVRDMDEAVALANRSAYALTASVWTGNRRRGRRLAARLRAGTVTVNDHLMTHGMPEISWGGPGASGLGRTHGRSGMLAMTREQNVVEERFPRIPRAFWWFPYDRSFGTGIEGVLTFFHGRGVVRRVRAGLRALAQVPRMFRDS
jgi:acyl-CoA reductase-like NAD-dependent aldehyde dehydrogenase